MGFLHNVKIQAPLFFFFSLFFKFPIIPSGYHKRKKWLAIGLLTKMEGPPARPRPLLFGKARQTIVHFVRVVLSRHLCVCVFPSMLLTGYHERRK